MIRGGVKAVIAARIADVDDAAVFGDGTCETLADGQANAAGYVGDDAHEDASRSVDEVKRAFLGVELMNHRVDESAQQIDQIDAAGEKRSCGQCHCFHCRKVVSC